MERYESLGLVGEGSYGTVLKCRHRESRRLVAIKKFVDSDDDKTVKKIALREIKLLRQLRHDNLVNLLEVWKRRRRWYLVFEFVERTLLDDLEQNPTGLDLNTSRQILFQILRAAAFCHQLNIIHRDIKPENILISQCGVVKMCDFGFARTMTSPAEGGVYTDYVATRWYRAPELLVGDTKYGKAVDVWAFGCLLLEMLTGQPLFPGDSDLDQIYHIVRCFGNLTAHHQELFYRNPGFSGVRLPEHSGRVPLDQRFPTIPPTALDLAQSCLQMDPERRAQCSELLEHPLFTQDSFHIRFLDELNAKIQKDHRENSTLPKITKTPRRERNEGDDRNRRSKEKKQTEDLDERGNKEKERKEEEKMEKTKGKQPSKLSKTIRNPSEPLISTKQSNTLGTKIDNVPKTTVPMLLSDISRESSTVFREATPVQSTITAAKGTSKFTKTGSYSDVKPTRGLPTDRGLSEISAKTQQDINEANDFEIYDASSGDYKENPESSEPSSVYQLRTPTSKITAESRTTVAIEISESDAPLGTIIPKTLKVSDKENREDLALSVSISSTTTSVVDQISKVEHSNYKSLIGEPKMKHGSFSNHSKSVATMTLKTQKMTFPTEARNKRDIPESKDGSADADSTRFNSTTPDHKALTRSFVFNTPDVDDDHFSMGSGFHPGNHSLRCAAKSRHHGGVYGRLSNHMSGSLTAQVSDKSQTCERSFVSDRGITATKKKSDVHFPGLRSSGLPEIRGREGKLNRGTSKDQRKPEAQQHGHTSTDSQTP
ncbi:hypothetical protein JOQ06_006532 [Pogonophryne albipinna]|uniref:Protein kinase domain-containing protein n=1 Tax=Pogonophryne albipinna TaxID=1090488 RepID=A0AAD6A4Z1_9TELE|nr:hypothetical protein JOQ06_006532 [Pogonophryne albipinna]